VAFGSFWHTGQIMSDPQNELGRLIPLLQDLIGLGERALQRQLPSKSLSPEEFAERVAFRWQRNARGGALRAIDHPDLFSLGNLRGVERQVNLLRRNTQQFLKGLPANNVLLWGDRGTGKSSAVRGLLEEFSSQGLRMVEVQKEDLFDLFEIARQLRGRPERFILFCDDLSFDENEIDYRALKALLEGGLEARPENVLVYATSNRRHLLPERITDNTDQEEIHPEERVAEKLSLSDRFGLSLGFYPFSQEDYLDIVGFLAKKERLQLHPTLLRQQALNWAALRGGRSGRVARQFVNDLCGRLGLEAEQKNEISEKTNKQDIFRNGEEV